MSDILQFVAPIRQAKACRTLNCITTHPEEGLDSFRSSDARSSESYVARNHECHLGSGDCRADKCELAPDPQSSLSHSLKTKMPLLTFCQDSRFDADPVVIHPQR